MNVPARISLVVFFLLGLGASMFSPVFAEDVTVTATVPSKSPDFHAVLVSSPIGSPASQDTTLTYTLTYGSNLPQDTPLQLTVSWSKGNLHGSSVDVLEYVIGSASRAYNETPPVVDTTNRTITWSIASFPANTITEELTFQLRTRNVHQNPDNISFTVSANVTDMTSAGKTTTLNQSYRYSPPAATTPAPTPRPTSPPQRSYPALAFSHIDVRRLTTDSATVYVAVTKPSQLTFRYGSSPTHLSSTIQSQPNQITQLFDMTNLKPSTNYYFQAFTTSGSESQTSDIFVITTSEASTPSAVDGSSVAVISQDILFSLQDIPQRTIVLPSGVSYTTQFSLSTNTAMRDITLILEDRDQTLSQQATMLETNPHVYSGTLTTLFPGIYTLQARLHDAKGNITTQPLYTLRVSPPITVLTKDKKGIEKARIELFRYDPASRLYTRISPQALPIPNPVTTDLNGIARIVLPHGRYQAQISAPFFEKKTTTFTLGPESTENYPHVILPESPFNFIGWITYTKDILLEYFDTSSSSLTVITSSTRLFMITNLLALALFIGLLLRLLSKKHNLAIIALPLHLLYAVRRLQPRKVLQGTVRNAETNLPIHHATVMLYDSSRKTPVSQVFTDREGVYTFAIHQGKKYRVAIQKKGFHASPLFEYDETDITSPLVVALMPQGVVQTSEGILQAIGQSIIEYGFEVALVITFVLEVFFMLSFGIEKVLPYFAVSLFSLLVYSLNHKRLI